MDGEVPEYRAAGMGGDQDTLTIDDYYFTHELLEVLRHDDEKQPASWSPAPTDNTASEADMASWLCELFQQHDGCQVTTKSGGSSGSGRGTPAASCKLVSSSGRRRKSASGKAAEQRRRDKINDKMRTLQQLMPTCTKTDKASTLEEVIQYIKSLQHQMQVLSNGYGVPTAISPPSGMVSTTSMQPVRDAFGGRRATSVALPPYPFSSTAFACPHYGNGMPLPVPYRDQIGSMYAAQQLAHRRQQT